MFMKSYNNKIIIWEKLDSNQRRCCHQQIYSLPPLTTQPSSRCRDWIRTNDLQIMSLTSYQKTALLCNKLGTIFDCPYSLKFNYTANKIKKAIIKAKRPTASVKAKPKIVNPKSCSRNEGFRPKAVIKAAKTIPTPAPTPASPIVAKPAPIILALCKVTFMLKFLLICLCKNREYTLDFRKRLERPLEKGNY